IRCSDKSIQLLTKTGLTANDAWVTLDRPGEVLLDPAAVTIPLRGEWIVFAVADGKLWHKTTTPNGGAGKPWTAVDNLNFTPASAPAAALDGANNPVLFAFDTDGKLWRVDYRLGLADWEGQPGELLPAEALSAQNIFQAKSVDSAHPFAMHAF